MADTLRYCRFYKFQNPFKGNLSWCCTISCQVFKGDFWKYMTSKMAHILCQRPQGERDRMDWEGREEVEGLITSTLIKRSFEKLA